MREFCDDDDNEQLKSIIFWDITPCSSLYNPDFRLADYSVCHLLAFGFFLLNLFSDPEDEGDMFL
jgi:hypothetical protein